MDSFSRMIELLLSFATQKSQDFSEEILKVVKMLFMRLLIAAASLALFCVGLSMLLSKIAQDLNQEILIGILICVSSLVIFLVALISGFFKTKKKKKESLKSPIEEALALLIVDIVQERRAERDRVKDKELS